jgi:Caspase domain
MGARIAFVVNALTGPELSGGISDSARIYAVLTDNSLGRCDPSRSPAPIHQCDSHITFIERLDEILSRVTPDDQMVIYFTGHGMYKNGIYCLEFGNTIKNHIAFDSIMNMLQTKSISRALIIVDACHSAALTPNVYILFRRRRDG